MERPSSTVVAGKTTVTLSLSQVNNKMNNIYLQNQNRNSAAATTTTTTTVDDSAEISIFEAEKYFNELNALEAPKPTVLGGNRVSPAENIPSGRVSSSVAEGYYRNYRTRSFRSAATPTASSEASWNSQTGLLSVQPGSMSANNLAAAEDKNKSRRSLSPPTPSTFRWLSLRKKCPCSCKKSVQIKDKSLQRQPENLLPPPPPPPTSSKLSSSTSSSTTISVDKVRHDSFQESWYRTRHSLTNPRDNSNDLIIPPQLQALGMRTSFSNANTAGANTTAFSFPVLSVNSAIKPPKPALAVALVDQDPGRDSLEIFRPASHNHLTVRSDRPLAFPASPDSRVRNGINAPADAIDDGASDSSSDLFEIESFSTATTMARVVGPQGMFMYRRGSLEEAAAGGGGGGGASSSAAVSFGHGLRGGRFDGLYERHQQQPSRRESLEEPTTECCYEPSEASIDWSVTTAEGFDRASVAYTSEADFGEFSEPRASSAAAEKSRRKPSGSGGGLLMSCRCEKAVSVGRPGPRPAKPAVAAPTTYAGEHGRGAGPAMALSSSSTLAMWAVGHKL